MMRQPELREAKHKLFQRLMQKPGVVGVGISEKERQGKGLGYLALTVYVKAKVDKAKLRPEDRVDTDPLVLEALGHRDDLDVKQIGEIKALSEWHVPHAEDTIDRRVTTLAFTGKTRPVRVGVSEGHYLITAGTGGVLVLNDVQKLLRLSNNHVYANTNDASLGDRILQPGPYDGGSAGERVGGLVDFIPIHFDGSPNRVDAAVRGLDGTESAALMSIGKKPTGQANASVGMEVMKVGRTTELTHGEIKDVDMTVLVGYGGGKQALFDNQILVAPRGPGRFSAGGDSGSPVFQDNVEGLPWVGLLFAGDESGTTTIVNHAHTVASLLGIALKVEGNGEPPPPPPPDDDKPGCNPFSRVLGWLERIFGDDVDGQCG